MQKLTRKSQRYLEQLSHMGTYTDAILLENQERLNDIENILCSDSSDSCFVKVLKHKLKKCSMFKLGSN